jgi:hypothetical protein
MSASTSALHCRHSQGSVRPRLHRSPPHRRQPRSLQPVKGLALSYHSGAGGAILRLWLLVEGLCAHHLGGVLPCGVTVYVIYRREDGTILNAAEESMVNQNPLLPGESLPFDISVWSGPVDFSSYVVQAYGDAE